MHSCQQLMMLWQVCCNQAYLSGFQSLHLCHCCVSAANCRCKTSQLVSPHPDVMIELLFALVVLGCLMVPGGLVQDRVICCTDRNVLHWHGSVAGGTGGCSYEVFLNAFCHLMMQVGLPVDHHLLHVVEAGGLAVAAVGTVAATLGELLAVRALWKQERERTKAKVETAAAAAVAAIDAYAAGEAVTHTPAATSTAAGAAAGDAGNAAGLHSAGDQDDGADFASRQAKNSSTGNGSAGSAASATAAAAADVLEDGSSLDSGWRWDDGASTGEPTPNSSSLAGSTSGCEADGAVVPGMNNLSAEGRQEL
jgi:hypothetical protein